jgi:hypothetical protein
MKRIATIAVLILSAVLTFPPILRSKAVYEVPGTASETLIPASVASQDASFDQSLSQSQVQAYVRTQAQIYGVNVQKAEWIIGHESQDCWQEGHYDAALAGHEPNGSTSYGCWQFNDGKN